MFKHRWSSYFLVLSVALVTIACSSESSTPITDPPGARGEGSYSLGPEMPTVFSFDQNSMFCAVSWGTFGAPGPGPFNDPNMGLANVNFGMVVYSLNVDSFEVSKGGAVMKGTARSITTVNDQIVENAVYNFTVDAFDGGDPSQDSFSMRLIGEGLMFNGHTFSGQKGTGLLGGDVVIPMT